MGGLVVEEGFPMNLLQKPAAQIAIRDPFSSFKGSARKGPTGVTRCGQNTTHKGMQVLIQRHFVSSL